MKREIYMGLVLFLLIFTSCATSKSRTISNNIKLKQCNLNIRKVEANVNGSSIKTIEEQVCIIANGLLESLKIEKNEDYDLEIKVFEKSYFNGTKFQHSIFLCCNIYDQSNDLVGAVSEFSTGNETFHSPETQEKILKKCLLGIKAMEL